MARYIQKISLGSGRERWVGWEIDGVGTEITGLYLADVFSEEELTTHGVRRFIPMEFDDFLRLGAVTNRAEEVSPMDDVDLSFRMDALLVAMERLRAGGTLDVPRAFLANIFGDGHLEDPRIQKRLNEWQDQGAVLNVGRDECYLKILRRLA